jgi:hypothetical protein
MSFVFVLMLVGQQEGFEVVDKLRQNANEENIMFHNKRFPFPSDIPMEKIFKPEHRTKWGNKEEGNTK